MRNSLLIILAIWLLMSATWVCYVGIMGAMRARKSLGLHWSVWIFLAPLVVLGIALDCLINLLMSLPFWDLPQEPLLTARLHRYRDQDKYIGTKRRSAAKFICEYWLNPFDPSGLHC